MNFRKYMHVERFGRTEVKGIEGGECYVFPKIDGTNASVWMDDNGQLQAGSRRRHLSEDSDNAGFWEFINSHNASGIFDFMVNNPHITLYGEWLVPHTLKTYREESWRKFYVFDAYDNNTEKYIHYNIYSVILDEFNVAYIPPICTIKNPHTEKLIRLLDSNQYLISDGCGSGEGIVIKNYDYTNRFGRTVWAKIVRNEFREKHAKNSDVKLSNQTAEVENDIVENYITEALVNKTVAKILRGRDWNSRMISELLSRVFYDLVSEDMWDICKKHKMPVIDFKRLNSLSIFKIKEIRRDLFK